MTRLKMIAPVFALLLSPVWPVRPAAAAEIPVVMLASHLPSAPSHSATAPAALTSVGSSSSAGSGRLKFSHGKHVEGAGIACADCHTDAPTSALSSDMLVGGHPSCESCHGDEVMSDCAFCHTTPEDIAPRPADDRELVFSHALHAGEQKLECNVCHEMPTGMDGPDADQPATAVFPAMESCSGCHADREASLNCETCHTDFATLVPGTHMVSEFRKEHKQPIRVGKMEMACASCHQETFCQECHTGDQLRGFTSGTGLATVPGARGLPKDSPKQLRLMQVHELNYRYTHSIEARGKSINCSSCHEAQTFCAECHDAGGVTGAIRPATHDEPGFVLTAPPGGRHAELGRRDIESCVSCHDAEGRDPSCMLCHDTK